MSVSLVDGAHWRPFLSADTMTAGFGEEPWTGVRRNRQPTTFDAWSLSLTIVLLGGTTAQTMRQNPVAKAGSQRRIRWRRDSLFCGHEGKKERPPDCCVPLSLSSRHGGRLWRTTRWEIGCWSRCPMHSGTNLEEKRRQKLRCDSGKSVNRDRQPQDRLGYKKKKRKTRK